MPHLKITLLGTFQVCLDGQRVTTFSYDKVRALLAYLAVEAGHAHRREALAGLLWAERPERAARQSLSQALSLLRRALGDVAALPPYLRVTRETLQFNTDSNYGLDVTTLTQHLAAMQAHSHARLAHCESCLAHLEEAVAFYGGDFLAGFSVGDSPAFEEWVRLQAEHLRFQVLEALSLLADSYLERGDCEAALRHARRQLALDPARESAHRQVMRALALDGHRGAALEQYETCCEVLSADYGLEPDAETRALYAEIRATGPECKSTSSAQTLASATAHNLPVQLTPFIGRVSELHEIETRLQHPDCRLLTLVGTGGSGKTRLALEAACAHLASFPDGVYQVALVGRRTSDGVLSAVADAVGLVFSKGRDPKDQLHDFLRDKTVLLILDSFEHLVAEAELVLEILRTTEQVKVVITSRVPIQAQGEWLFPVAGLGLSDTLDDPEAAAQSDAVRLFVASAQRIDPGFEPTKDDLWHVLRICQLVRGLPLAILLAASWTAMLSPADIASHLLDELTSDLDFLRADWCDVPARQRSIRAVFDHSWALLGEREREQFCALSVFRGGFARDAAQAVAQVSLHDLMALVGRSLVHRGESGRYEMHELLRQYAAEKLALSQAESAVRDRHSAYYTAACQQWEVDLDSPRERIPLAVMDVEIENVRLAWDWAVARHEIERLDQALSALAYFYWQRVRLEEGAKAFGQAAQRLSALAEQSPAVSVDETHILGRVLWAQGRFAKGKTRQQLLRRALALLKGPQLAGYDVRSEKAVILLDLAYEYDPDHGGSGTVEATPLYEQSLVLFRELGDQRGAIRALSGLGGVAWSLGEYDRARLLMEECLELSPAVATPELVAPLLGRLGFVYLHRGELEQGERLFRKALSMAEQGQASWRIPSACVFLGVALTYQGRYVEARLTIKRALSFAENLSGYYVSGIENDLGNAEMHRGQYEQARILGEQALALAGSPRRKALCLFLLGRVALVEGRFVEARAHLQEGTDISRELELKNDLALSLAALACTDLGLGRSDRAWRSATEVLHISSEIQGFRPCLYGLAVYALLILDQGETARAIEIYTLLLTYGHVAHSRWFEDVVGQHIAAAVSTASLPPEAIAAARKRGQGRDLQATARELLAELELEADGSASG